MQKHLFGRPRPPLTGTEITPDSVDSNITDIVDYEARMKEWSATPWGQEWETLDEAAKWHERTVPSESFEDISRLRSLRDSQSEQPTSTVAGLISEAEERIKARSEGHGTRAQHLRKLADRVIEIAVANSESVDSSRVLNPEKAEHMAYSVKPHMDRAGRWYTLRRGMHKRRADREADFAAQEYDRSLKS